MGFFAAAVACRFLAPAPVPELAFSSLSAKRNPPFPSRRRGIVEFCPSRERRGPIQRWHGRAEARVRSEFFSSTAAPIGLRSTPTTAERKKTMPRAKKKSTPFRRHRAALSSRRRCERPGVTPEHASEARGSAKRVSAGGSRGEKELGGGLRGMDLSSSLSFFFLPLNIDLKLAPTPPPRALAPPRATLPSPRGQLEHALNDPKTDDSHLVLLLVCSRGVRKGEGEGGKKGTVMEKNCDDEKKKIFLSLSLSVSLLFRPLLSASLSLPFLLLLLLVFSRKHAMREEGRHRRCGSGIGVLPNEG